MNGQVGDITTVLGPTPTLTGTTTPLSKFEPMSVAFDSAGNLYTADLGDCVVLKTTFTNGLASTSLFAGEVGQCGPTTTTGQTNPLNNVLLSPTGVAVCGGNVYIATHGFATQSIYPNYATSTISGGIYKVDTNGNFSNLQLKSTEATPVDLYPVALACFTDSNKVDHIYVSSYWFGPIADSSTIAGELDELTPSVSSATTSLNIANVYTVYTGIAVNPTDSNLYGVSAYVPGSYGWNGPQAFFGAGLYSLTPGNNAVGSTVYKSASGLVIDSGGNYLISLGPYDGLANEVGKVPPAGGVPTYIAGNGTLGFSGDGGLATSAELNGAQGLAIDPNGNIYIADALNNRVRKVQVAAGGPTGQATTLTLGLQFSTSDTATSNTATATITPNVNPITITGSVTFTYALAGSSTALPLCSQMPVTSGRGGFQAVCPFTSPATAGTYIVTAVYSGDAQNLPSSNTTTLTVAPSPPGPPSVSGYTAGATPIAVSQNNSGVAYNAILNADTTVNFVQDGAIVAGMSCPALANTTGAAPLAPLQGGVVYLDGANKYVYLVVANGSGAYATYEAIQPGGSCVQGPVVQILNTAVSYYAYQINADTAKGNVYITIATQGGIGDTLNIVPTAPWSSNSLPTPIVLNLDYSATYGPIEIDPSNHQVYINDLNGGFFIFDPTLPPPVANNIERVVGYDDGTGTQLPFSAAAVLTNGAGKVVLANQNSSGVSPLPSLATPVTILDTTKFNFFSNTVPLQTGPPNYFTQGTIIKPGAGFSQIASSAGYTSMGAADIDIVGGLVYAYAYSSYGGQGVAPTPNSGLLLQYNVAAASPTETVLARNLALPVIYQVNGPWSQLNYDPATTQLIASTSSYSEVSLGISSPVCAGSPLTLPQLVGNSGQSPLSGLPSVNALSGYVYAIEGSNIAFIAPPSPGCSTTKTVQISPAALPAGSVGTPYSQQLTASGGTPPYTFTVSSGTLPAGITLNGATLSGSPTASGSSTFTITAQDSAGISASLTYTLSIAACSGKLAISPPSGQLPPATIGLIYNEGFTVTGEALGTVTWNASNLPSGLNFLQSGVLEGNSVGGPPGQKTFSVYVTDGAGCTTGNGYELEVYNPLTVTTPPANATVGQAYTGSFTASGGVGPYTYVALGTPPGLTLNQNTGALTGTPTQTGSFTISVLATDTLGAEGVVKITLVVVQGAALQIADNETITVSDNTPTVQLVDVADSESITVTDTVLVQVVDVSDPSESITVTDTVLVKVLAPTTTTVAAAVTSGDVATLTATVTSATSGTPTGTVSFSDNGTAVGTAQPLVAGVATLAGATLPFGGQSIVATYSGDANFLGSTSSALNEFIGDFTLSLGASTPIILPGQSATVTITATPVGGPFNNSISLSVSGLPAGATATFSSTALTPGASAATATVIIQSPPQLAQNRSWGQSKYAMPILLGLLLPLVGIRRKGRRAGIYWVWLVALSLGVITGLGGCGSGGFFIQPAKTYTVTVTGTSGTLQHSSTIELTVQ